MEGDRPAPHGGDIIKIRDAVGLKYTPNCRPLHREKPRIVSRGSRGGSRARSPRNGELRNLPNATAREGNSTGARPRAQTLCFS